MSIEEFESHYIKTSEKVTLHVKTAGNPDNPTIVLLHGFPEFWKGWYEVALRLLDEDYYLILPDQRGYNLSSTPFWIGDYRMDKLIEDIKEVIAWSGKEKVILGGHDWGGAVAWALISVYPELIEKLIIANIPHTRTMKKYMRNNFSQLRKSWYMFALQIPLIPQLMMRAFNFRLLRNTIKNSAIPETFTDEDLEEYTNAWSKSGVSPMINWYRAMVRRTSGIYYGKIEPPVLIIWGRKDKFLEEEMAELSLDHCINGKVEYVEEATHWILHEMPDHVSALMLDFITAEISED